MGIEREPVPVAGEVENLSPMPRIEPPPLGREMDGMEGRVGTESSQTDCFEESSEEEEGPWGSSPAPPVEDWSGIEVVAWSDADARSCPFLAESINSIPN
jgi:hypothetical protein